MENEKFEKWHNNIDNMPNCELFFNIISKYISDRIYEKLFHIIIKIQKEAFEAGQKSKENEWKRGYFCAVAMLLKMNGDVTTLIKELFFGGGNVKDADEEDIKTFKKYKLI